MSESVSSLLSQLSLGEDYASIVSTETIEEWKELGRPELLKRLQLLGVQLPHRQAIANGLRKYVRQQNILPVISALQQASSIVVVRTTYGLCNQLRALLSYRAEALAQGKFLVLHWQRTAACKAKFCELFEPMEGCFVVDEESDFDLVKPHLSRIPNQFFPSTYALHPSILGTEVETSMWLPLKPLPALRARIADKLRALAPSFVAVHVRRTDHMKEAGQMELARKSNALTSDESFVDFLERHAAPGEHIYVATDNALSQRALMERFGDRIISPTPIAPPPERATERAAYLQSVHRHTAVQDAVVDIFTCAAARVFKGTYYSSFSDAIMRLRRAHGGAHTEDEHNLALPAWDPMITGQIRDESVSLEAPALLALLEKMAAYPIDYGQAHRAWLEEGWCEREQALGVGVEPHAKDGMGHDRCIRTGALTPAREQPV
jgi:hypothetical protein